MASVGVAANDIRRIRDSEDYSEYNAISGQVRWQAVLEFYRTTNARASPLVSPTLEADSLGVCRGFTQDVRGWKSWTIPGNGISAAVRDGAKT